MRTPEDLRHHYEIERDLADRLRAAKREDRALLYGQVYDELFQRVPSHPQLTRKDDDDERKSAVAERFALLSRFLNRDTVFLEIGAGDCSLSRHVSQYVRKSYALDVSNEILDRACESNMETVLSDGCSIPIPDDSVTLAYSYQVMEHIHPDDAKEQLGNIYRVLAPGGKYLCVTPNMLNGPHDVSRYFDDVATGLHLKEYTVIELDRLFRSTGFRRTQSYVGLSHRYFNAPVWSLAALEVMMGGLPHAASRWLGSIRGFQNLLFISFVGIK